MSVEFRTAASETDWAAYHAIRRRVLFELRGNGSAYDANRADEHLPGHYPFVLWDGNDAVGVIRIDVHDAVATFRRVAIREDLQRRGYGRHLLEAAERFAVEQGCGRLVSHVDAGAVGFYERCGFRREDAQPGNHAIAMSKQLS